MKLEIAKIVGALTERGWSQVHTFIPEEKEKLALRGQFLAVMNLTSEGEGIDIASAGREIISRLHEEYYGSLEKRPFAQLESSVERVIQEAEGEAKIEIVAGCLIDDVLYLAIVGGGKALLLRGGKLVTIVQGSFSQATETASGYLQESDVFLLGTGSFFEVVGGGVIQAALATGSAQEAVEVLTPAVLGKEEKGLAAAVIAKAKEEEPESLPQPKKEALKKLLLKIKQKITERPSKKPKKSLFTVALVLFLLLGISVGLGARQRKRQTAERKIKTVLEQVKAKKEEGEAILSLNPAKARELLKEAEELLKQVGGDKQELETSLSSVLQEYEVEPSLFFDLELIKKGARGSDLSFFGGQLVILDKENLAVYGIGVGDKKSAILAGGKEIEGASQVVAFGPKVFILTNEGIFQTDKEGENLSLVVKADKEWQEIVDFQVFGGNLYLLDKNTIWQYPAFADLPAGKAGASVGKPAFGTKKQWLKGEADFSNAAMMAIDGAIWVLKSNGIIEKYLRGDKDSFGAAGLDKPFLEAEVLYTDSEQEYLYVLDKGNSRVVVLNKNGEYHSQYLGPEIKNANGLVVSEKEKKIFLLGGSKVYQIELR